MSVMPAPMRNADILKQLFNDPAMKKRISEMIAKRVRGRRRWGPGGGGGGVATK